MDAWLAFERCSRQCVEDWIQTAEGAKAFAAVLHASVGLGAVRMALMAYRTHVPLETRTHAVLKASACLGLSLSIEQALACDAQADYPADDRADACEQSQRCALHRSAQEPEPEPEPDPESQSA